MTLTGRVSFLALAALLAATVPALSTGVEDANNAVIAARSGQYEEAIRLFTSAINSDELNLKSRARPAIAASPKATAVIGGAVLDLNYAVALNSDYDGDAYGFRGYLNRSVSKRGRRRSRQARPADLAVQCAVAPPRASQGRNSRHGRAVAGQQRNDSRRQSRTGRKSRPGALARTRGEIHDGAGDPGTSRSRSQGRRSATAGGTRLRRGLLSRRG